MNLTKSDFISGYNCPKALWLKKQHPELLPDNNFDYYPSEDYRTKQLAQQLYPHGVTVRTAIRDHLRASRQTKKLLLTNKTVFEASALTENGLYCQIDILGKNVDKLNLTEIKSNLDVKDENLLDLAFQYYVFTQAGYRIQECFLLLPNRNYVRKGDLDLKNLFIKSNVTSEIKKISDEVRTTATKLLEIQTSTIEPPARITKTCKDCPFFSYCCPDLPNYSIFDIFDKKEFNSVLSETGTYSADKLNPDDYSDKHAIDIRAWQTQKIHYEKEKLTDFISKLEYPLYYLDYETIMPTIPLFDKSAPYQQIPFQFSLHIQYQPHGKVTHIGFLHQFKTDPRRALAESLVKNCGTTGSVIVYNESFEKTRNRELANLFPDLRDAILAINQRVLDQYKPFRTRSLYHYKQNSSASIKKVLPSFTDLSYDDMEVKNGTEAMERYLTFLKGELTPPEEQILLDGLNKYCAQDTYAMVKLMEVLYHYAAQ